MIIIDEPAVVQGLPVWTAWMQRLDALPAREQADPGVIHARQHAMRVIAILTRYPTGLSAQHPDFRKIVRELAREFPVEI